MAHAWKDALLVYLAAPETHNEVVFFDDSVVVVRDKYPKAKLHLLVVPRTPMPFGVASLTKEHVPLLQHMASVVDGLAVAEDVRLGFHAVPSMRQLHLHVISTDLMSPALKKKEHWNSFTTSFFKPLVWVLDSLENADMIHIDEADEAAKLKRPLACHKCHTDFSTLPKLKQHLEKYHPPSDSKRRLTQIPEAPLPKRSKVANN
ncbi:histidine triad family protein [Achlya hypogyna]|uniref:Histidine triad family protein n=1 Tax=Achlya hypogyna TaxID=1202772 RepID=A0A1V9ZA29_ACHHY|nr:histidine triad family protein [Achlya hypogyna]